MTVSNVDFTATSNGVRIKTWAKNSKSFARNIVFQHISMKMVKNPIIIDQHYCFYKPCPKQVKGNKLTISYTLISIYILSHFNFVYFITGVWS